MKIDVKRIRKNLDLTQYQLAIELELSPSAVAKWEADTHQPSKNSKERLQELAKKGGIEFSTVH